MRDALMMRDAREILDEIERRGVSRSDVARVLKISQPNATKLWQPDKRTGKTRALKTDEAQLLMRTFKLFEHDQAFGHGKRPEAGHTSRAPEQPSIATADGGETGKVLRLDLSYAMGDGTDLDAGYFEGEPFEFDLGFLRNFTISPPDRLRIVDGIGDSMKPTIDDREMLLIDLNQNQLNAQDRVWAIGLYGAGAVKRLQLVAEDRVLVISDNPTVPDREVHRRDVVIVGRVVGSIKRH